MAWNQKKEAIAFHRLGCRTGIGETVGVATFGAAEKPGETSSCTKRVDRILYPILFIVTYRGVFLQSADVDVPAKHMGYTSYAVILDDHDIYVECQVEVHDLSSECNLQYFHMDIGALRREIIVYCLPFEPKTMKNTGFEPETYGS